MGLDLDGAEVMMDLEREFGIDIPGDMPWRTPVTVGEVAAYVQATVDMRAYHDFSRSRIVTVREALAEALRVPVEQITADTELRALIPTQSLREAWPAIGDALRQRGFSAPGTSYEGERWGCFLYGVPTLVGLVLIFTPARIVGGILFLGWWFIAWAITRLLVTLAPRLRDDMVTVSDLAAGTRSIDHWNRADLSASGDKAPKGIDPDIQRRIIQIFAQHTGMPAENIGLSTRLVEDLGLE